MNTSTRTTLAAAAATFLGAIPLAGGFAQQRWLWYTALALAMVCCVGLLTRTARLPAVMTLVLQLAVLLIFHSVVFDGRHALWHVLPTDRTIHDLARSLSDGIDATRYLAAPVPSQTSILILTSMSMGAVGIVVDLVAATLRHPAIAGLALLAVFAVATAVSTGVLWLEFLCAGAGYLLLLSADGRDRLVRWGRLVVADDRPGRVEPVPAARVPRHHAGGRLGALALAAALVVPVFIPAFDRNVFAEIGRTHNGSGGGTGSGAINPFAAMQGQLNLDKPVDVLSVTANVDPWYLRTIVLDQYTPDGWVSSRRPFDQRSIATKMTPAGELPVLRAAGQTREVRARITVKKYSDSYLPLYYSPTGITGAGTGWKYDDDRTQVTGRSLNSGTVYRISASEPSPDVATAQAAKPLAAGAAQLREWGDLPATLPASVRALTESVTRTSRSPYAKAAALEQFFTDGRHHFAYSLSTTSGASTSKLVNFLQKRKGFCEQYASAMAVMLRVIGVPSRVVLGYTTGARGAGNTWTVSSSNAHAWVEGYFSGIGWIPFDPTPASGPNNSEPPPYLQPSGPPTSSPTPSRSAVTGPSATTPTPTDSLSASGGGGSGGGRGGLTAPATVGIVVGVLLVLGLVATPGLLRRSARRRRFGLAAGPDPVVAAGAAWEEILATATDWGIGTSRAESPRATAARLARTPDLPPDAMAALPVVAMAEERARYARQAGSDGDLAEALRTVCAGLAAGRSRGTRLRVALLPGSTRAGLAAELWEGTRRVARLLDGFHRSSRPRSAR